MNSSISIDPNLPQLPYIVTDLFIQMNRLTDKVSTDYLTMQLHAVMAYTFRDDAEFHAEWDAIQEDRRALKGNGYYQNMEGFEDHDLAFRMRERAALATAAQRNGVISRLPTPKSTFNPKAMAAKAVV